MKEEAIVKRTLEEFAKSRGKDADGNMFYKSYDHLGHNPSTNHLSMNHIKVMHEELTREDGRECMPYDWAVVHWTATTKSGHLVESSRDFHQGFPRVFQLGNYQVMRCWDLTLMNMKGGQNIEVYCPSEYAYGDVETYNHFGSETIKHNTDLIYYLELLECQ